MLFFLPALLRAPLIVHAADVSDYSGLVTYSQWIAANDPKVWRWKDGSSGVGFAITSGYQGNGEQNLFAAEQMATARAAGIPTAGYALISREKPGDQQVQDALAVFGADRRFLSFFVIDVEDPAIDKNDHSIHPELIQSALEQVKRSHLKPVIYTSRRIWKLTPWMDKNPYSDLPLWDASYDDADVLDLTKGKPFTPYGGWTKRFGKQYNDESHGDGLKFVNTTKIIGADVNVFDGSIVPSQRVPKLLPCLYVQDSYAYKKGEERKGPNVAGGTDAVITIDLTSPQGPASGFIRLTTDAPAVLQLPEFVSADTKQLVIKTQTVKDPIVVTVSATYGGGTASTVFRLMPQ